MSSVSREESIKNAVELCCHQLKTPPKNDDISFIFSAGEIFREYVVGQSLKEFILRANQLDANSSHNYIRKVSSPNTTSRPRIDFELMDNDNTPRYRISIEEDSGPALQCVDLSLIDYDRPNHPYSDIVTRTIFSQRDRNLFDVIISPCHTRMFGDFVKAMNILRPITDIPLSNKVRLLNENNKRKPLDTAEHLNYGDLLKLDGGIVGAACEEVAIAVQDAVIKHIMPLNKKVFSHLVDTMKEKNIVWGEKYVEYYGGDNKSCLIPLKNGDMSMVHVSIHFTEPHTGYIAVAENDVFGEIEQMSIYAVDQETDNIPLLIEALQSNALDKSPTFRFDFKNEQAHFNEKLESTGIAEAFSFHLNWDFEIMVQDIASLDHVSIVSFDERNEFKPFDEEDDYVFGLDGIHKL